MSLYLDTHVVVWLYEGLIEKLSKHAKQLINGNDLLISPMTQLELVYLYETKKISRTASTIIHELYVRVGLQLCEMPFDAVVDKASSLDWTRDPFDRMIAAQALCAKSKLLTKDKIIRKHCKSAVWG